MKIQFRSILFALVLPAAACGGGRDAPEVDTTPTVGVAQSKSESRPIVKPASPAVVGETPAVLADAPMPTKYDELLVVGKDRVAKGAYDDAKQMFEAAAKLEPKRAEPHIELARMYIAMKRRGPAVAAANKAVKLAPASSVAWNTLGRAELNAHKYEEAIAAFTKAIEVNDTNVYAWNNLGYTELLLQRYEDAAAHLIEATSRPGATGYMFNNLGVALEHLDRLDEARLAYETGGELGSKAARASRKRLEGVETIMIASSDHGEGAVHGAPRSYEYELAEDGGEVDEAEGVDDEDTAHLDAESADDATL